MKYHYEINEHSRLLLQGQNHVYHGNCAQDYCIIIHSLLFKVYGISKLALNMIKKKHKKTANGINYTQICYTIDRRNKVKHRRV